MGKTKPFVRPFLPASGLIVFTACVGMPPGTSLLTDEERKEVEAVLDELEIETPVVEGLLGVADPLFDVQGNPTPDNRELVFGVGEVLDDIQGMAHADRIVTRPFEDQPSGIEAAARGSRTEVVQVDDYIILTLNSEGELVLPPGLLMHEGTHYFFGAHDRSFLDAQDPSMSAQEALALALEHRDAPNTVDHLFDIAQAAYGVGERLLEDTQDLAQMETFFGGDAAAQHNRQQRFDYLNGFLRLGLEGWAQQLSGILWSSQAETFELLGVTRDELQVALSEADELFESHREAARGAMEFWQETFPEFREEVAPERLGEGRHR